MRFYRYFDTVIGDTYVPTFDRHNAICECVQLYDVCLRRDLVRCNDDEILRIIAKPIVLTQWKLLAQLSFGR